MSRLVAAYASELAVRLGEDMSFHAHADRPLDLPLAGAIGAGRIAVHPQPIAAGSSAHVTPQQPVMLESFSLGLALMPTRLPPESAGVLALQDYTGTAAVLLRIDAQVCLAITVRAQGDAAVLRLPLALPLRRWAMVSLALDAASGTITAAARIIGEGQGDPCGLAEVSQAIAPVPFALSGMLIASDGEAPSFDGKIDALRVRAGACPRKAIEALVQDPASVLARFRSAEPFAWPEAGR